MKANFQFTLNGKPQRISAEARRTLLEVLREDLDLTGTKYGCGEGQCRACTVLLDGNPVRSCLTEISEVEGRKVETSRREFVQVLGAGVVLSIAVPSLFAQRASENGPTNLAQRLHIGAEGAITVLTSKVEVGQGSRTQLTQAAAEELRVPVDRVRFIMADTAVVPDDGGTAGSGTTPRSVPAIRRGCAAARQLLIDTAAAAFNADAKRLSVHDGNVEGLGAGQQFSYADLASEKHSKALQREVASGVSPFEAKEWRVLGTPVPRVGANEIVTGAHRYPSDIRRPGMLYGKVLRPASYGAQLEEIDLAPAKAIRS